MPLVSPGSYVHKGGGLILDKVDTWFHLLGIVFCVCLVTISIIVIIM